MNIYIKIYISFLMKLLKTLTLLLDRNEQVSQSFRKNCEMRTRKSRETLSKLIMAHEISRGIEFAIGFFQLKGKGVK